MPPSNPWAIGKRENGGFDFRINPASGCARFAPILLKNPIDGSEARGGADMI
jgi:hypothetical protein